MYAAYFVHLPTVNLNAPIKWGEEYDHEIQNLK
jgi:hypothetical protein